MAFVILLALLAALTLLYLWYLKYVKSLKLLEKVAGPRNLLLLGNLVDLAKQGNPAYNMLPYLMDVVKTYGPRTKLHLGWNPTLILANAEDLQKLLSSPVLINKGSTYKILQDMLGLCLTTATDDVWRSKRKMLQPSFSYSKLEKYVNVMDKQCQIFIDILEQEGRNGQVVDVAPLINRCALDIITQTAMGCEMNIQTKGTVKYSEAFAKWFNVLLQPDFIWRNIPDGKEWERQKKVLYNTVDMVISERKSKRAISKSTSEVSDETEGNKRSLAFLDTLLQFQEEDPNSLTDEDIRSETNLFIAGGYETTATALQSIFMRIGYHTDIQRKMQAEVDEVFNSTQGKSLTWDDLRRLDYMEMVIKEVMRLYPVAPVLMRYLDQPLTLDSKTVIPPGVTVFIFLYALHRNPDMFPNPDEFIPERFSTDECNKRHPFAYIPFLAGPRSCIGYKFAMMEMKMLLAHTLRHFNITSVSKGNPFEMEYMTTLKPNGGVNVLLTKRIH